MHFWIGYLHPFVDGNGRLARTLFYWYLLKKKYWTFMYLPISLVIKRAPIQYSMAYIYSEQDSYDATYFFDFHIRKIIQALNDFNEYVSEKILENKQIDSIISKDINLVDRQRYLIHHLASETNAYSTITSHATLNNISRQTAAKDIKQLVNIGLVKGTKEGKYIKYRATQKLLDMHLA
ncbi:Fic family protein [Candidatus Daviesbacteria bacterium]|nr:Fic family protein [Candidatus Daviesbacteria bacterium]